MKWNATIYVILTLLAGLFLSYFVLYTPIPNTDDESVFNTRIATEHIARIAQDQHSVYDPANHEDVRVYLRDQLIAYLGAENVQEMDYDRSLVTLDDGDDELTYDIHNLLGVIEGDSPTGILLVGHYDSRGHIGRTGELGESYGAADDGYAIATMLEIARLYADRDLENSIYILMTDAEETGLYGAQMAAQEDFVDNIALVINIEARGVKGPVYMFETSTPNDKVVEFYANVELPVSYSLATAVYTVMPNSTDFTEFLAIDKPGLNFAVLNGLQYYHTPFDNYTNINQSSIEHYGMQIVPLVEEFATNSDYSGVDSFEGESDKVFFTLFANVFVHYGEGFAKVLHIVLFLTIIGFTAWLFAKKELKAKSFLIAGVLIDVALIAAVVLGNVVGRLVAFFSKVPFNMTYVRTMHGDVPALLTLVGITGGLFWWYRAKADDKKPSILLWGAIINLFLALVTGFVLSGASFLFLIVGLTGLIVVVFDRFVTNPIARRIIYALLMVLNIIIVVPILFSLYLALTIGGLLALGAILVFYLSVLIPLADLQLEL